MKAIILDGWHHGMVIPLRELLPVIRLNRPRTLTECDCNAEGLPDIAHVSGPTVDVYRIAFTPVDRNVVLYSRKGDSAALINSPGRAWVNRGLAPEQDVYVDCRDPRAWMTSEPQATEPT